MDKQTLRELKDALDGEIAKTAQDESNAAILPNGRIKDGTISFLSGKISGLTIALDIVVDRLEE